MRRNGWVIGAAFLAAVTGGALSVTVLNQNTPEPAHVHKIDTITGTVFTGDTVTTAVPLDTTTTTAAVSETTTTIAAVTTTTAALATRVDNLDNRVTKLEQASTTTTSTVAPSTTTTTAAPPDVAWCQEHSYSMNCPQPQTSETSTTVVSGG